MNSARPPTVKEAGGDLNCDASDLSSALVAIISIGAEKGLNVALVRNSRGVPMCRTANRLQSLVQKYRQAGGARTEPTRARSVQRVAEFGAKRPRDQLLEAFDLPSNAQAAEMPSWVAASK